MLKHDVYDGGMMQNDIKQQRDGKKTNHIPVILLFSSFVFNVTVHTAQKYERNR